MQKYKERIMEDVGRIAKEDLREIAKKGVDPEDDESTDIFNTQSVDYLIKQKYNTPAIRDLDPAIKELTYANHIRCERESSFEGRFLDDKDVPKYVNLIEHEIIHRLQSLTYQAYEIGELLSIIKKLLPHGKFDAWITSFRLISKSTALNFMRVYRNCLGHPEMLEYFKKSVLYEICAPKFPEDFRNFIFETIEGPVDIKKKELLETAIKWKQKLITPKSPEVTRLLKLNRFETKAKKYIGELKRIKSFLEGSTKRIMVLNCVDDPHPYLSDDENEKIDDRFIQFEKKIKDFNVKVTHLIKDLENKK